MHPLSLSQSNSQNKEGGGGEKEEGGEGREGRRRDEGGEAGVREERERFILRNSLMIVEVGKLKICRVS